ncbi:MAG: sensor histidine kinase [Oscillospiraceae bacterium]
MRKLFFAYLREKRWTLLVFALFLVIFGVVCDLYAAEWEAYLYAAGLCVFVGLVVMGIRFARFCRRHEERRLKAAAVEQEYLNLPASETLAEADYQAMIAELGRRCRGLSTAFETERQDSLDYYTTWVHQIKTPIAVMEMVLRSEDTEEHRALSAELFRIEQYVEMVLSYIRLGGGANDLVLQEYALDDLIRRSVRKYAPQFIRKKIRLTYEPTAVTVLTDEKWLCFLLEQLLSNAVKYTPQGGVTIEVSPEKVLTIRDTGIGIAPEDLPRIFEKGFTGYNGRADKKSTGLGLYLCKQAAEKLGIRITAASEPGVGTAISLALASAKLEVE